jgi:pilus assembly protein CpaB
LNFARIILIVAAFSVAGVTALLVKNYLQSREAEFSVTNEEPKIEKVPTVRVLVADSDLAAGTVVRENFLRWQTWPNDGLSPEYIVQGKDGTSDKSADFSGWAVRRGIATGEPITRHRLLEPGAAGFLAGALSPGMRATSISVNAETGAAGFILPGDRVDVMLTQQISQTRGDVGVNRDKIISEIVISNVRVLAIDQDFNDIDEQTRVGKTVTLELTPKQAESLAVAKRMGKISLSLRSFLRNADIEKKSTFTSDEDVSNFLRDRDPTPVQVLVAKHKLTAGALLRDTDFTWQNLGAGESGKRYISKTLTSAATLRGSYLKVDVEGNKAIPQDAIIRPGEHGFIVAALLPGMRAISMAVSQVTSVSGYIAPGDRIDLLLTHEVEDKAEKPELTPRRYSETILEDLRLLAIEQIVDPKTGKPQAGETVTLEVTPDQAEVVTLGAAMGILSLSLRSVPAGESGTDYDEHQLSTASDLGISPAISDFMIFRTFNDPNLLRRRVQMSKLLNVNKKTSPRPRVIDSSTKSVTIYRAATPSTVIVKR